MHHLLICFTFVSIVDSKTYDWKPGRVYNSKPNDHVSSQTRFDYRSLIIFRDCGLVGYRVTTFKGLMTMLPYQTRVSRIACWFPVCVGLDVFCPFLDRLFLVSGGRFHVFIAVFALSVETINIRLFLSAAYSTLNSSTSKVRVAFGGMTPGWPRLP